MRLSQKLLGWLNRAFSKDPEAFLAFRLRYNGTMQWTVADGFLSTSVTGGTGAALSVDLSAHTVMSLAGFLELQPGYSVLDVAQGENGAASALRLLDGTGNPDQSNGDHLLAYSSVLFAYVDTLAAELEQAQAAIEAMPDEMSTTSADGPWLDYLGLYYNVPRFVGESDPLYGQRIIAEVLRPVGNGVAIELAIEAYTGQSVTITDVVQYLSPEPYFDGTWTWNGAYTFNPTSTPVYGLFDATIGYDLLGGDVPTAWTTKLRTIINRLRDAGTHLRAISLTGSVLRDTAPWPGDDTDTLTITLRRRWDGARSFDGTWAFAGDTQEFGHLAGPTSTAPVAMRFGVLVRPGGVNIGVLTLDQTGTPIPLNAPFDPLATVADVDIIYGGAANEVLVPDGSGGTVPLGLPALP